MRSAPAAAFTLLLSLGCESDSKRALPSAEGSDCAGATTLSFRPDVGDAGEAYTCYGFDAATFEGPSIGRVRWSVPRGGGIALHHAVLYATTGEFPDGPIPCNGMPPNATELHLWSPGGSDLTLPNDVGLRLPQDTRRFVIEAHAIRVAAGGANASRVDICAAIAPAIEAAHIGMGAPVPALRPLHVETATGSCTLAGDVHLWSIWPHMHRAGREIIGELVRATGTAETLVDVTSWDFNDQKTYPLSVDARDGDSIRVTCTWDNTTANTILPGPLTQNEMCNLALTAWPAASAACL